MVDYRAFPYWIDMVHKTLVSLSCVWLKRCTVGLFGCEGPCFDMVIYAAAFVCFVLAIVVSVSQVIG